jgi:hypothetical protein
MMPVFASGRSLHADAAAAYAVAGVASRPPARGAASPVGVGARAAVAEVI